MVGVPLERHLIASPKQSQQKAGCHSITSGTSAISFGTGAPVGLVPAWAVMRGTPNPLDTSSTGNFHDRHEPGGAFHERSSVQGEVPCFSIGSIDRGVDRAGITWSTLSGQILPHSRHRKIAMNALIVPTCLKPCAFPAAPLRGQSSCAHARQGDGGSGVGAERLEVLR